jgi:hypothetical protein
VIKIAFNIEPVLDNNLFFNSVNGIYWINFQISRNENCSSCSKSIEKLKYIEKEKVQELRNRISTSFGMNNCSLYAGDIKIFWNILESTHFNLERRVKDLVSDLMLFSL